MTESVKPEHYDVIILTPGKMMHAEYVNSIVRTIEFFHQNWLTVKWISKHSSFVPTARELTATDTWNHDYSSNEIAQGKYTYNKLFWIDSDIEWEPEDFYRLYLSDHDVISGLYCLDQVGNVAVGYTNEHGMFTRVNKVEFLLHEQPVEVSGVGLGFLCVKSGVFESIPRPWFLIGKMKWSPDSDFYVNVGEDYSWCGKAQQAGYKIMVDPMVKVRHHKETVYEV